MLELPHALPGEADALADRVGIIEGGRLVAEGAPAVDLQDPEDWAAAAVPLVLVVPAEPLEPAEGAAALLYKASR